MGMKSGKSGSVLRTIQPMRSMKNLLCLLILGQVMFGSLLDTSNAAPATPSFKAIDIDTRIEIGYGIAVADVDGDKKPDILLADKRQIAWYKNPTWAKYVIAENL